MRPCRFTILSVVLALSLTACGDDTGRGTLAREGGGAVVHADEARGVLTEAFVPGPDGVTPVRGDTAVLTLLAEIDSLNPFISSSADASEVHDLIYPRLYVEEADYYDGPPTFTPNIAEGQPVAGEDGLSLTFRLRECTWSDGQPITADDVRFSWEAARSSDVAWVSASIVDFIEELEVQGPRDFTVHYSERYPYQQMDVNDIQILPRHVFGKVPFEQWQTHGRWESQAAVSGGPFLLESLKSDEVVLVRNPRYWKEGRPYLDRVIFRVIKDLRPQLTSVLAGDVDCMPSVTPKDADKILEAEHLRLFTYLTRSYGYIGWNCGRPPFDDARVRRAMSHAIDVDDIVESLFRGYANVAAPQIIRTFWASNPDIEPVPYDPDRAEALLQEAGWAKNEDGIYAKDGAPLRFTMLYNAGNAIRERICILTKANLKQVGVEMDVQPIDFNQMSQQLKLHEFMAYVGGWYVATKVDLKPTWHSTSADGRFNYVDYANDRVDAIIEEARVMADFERARPLWYELQEILHADQPYTMLYEPRALAALDKRFRNVRMNALRHYGNLDEWWVPKDEQRFP